MITPNFVTQKIEDTQSYGKFILEPLAPGFGQSIGLALRRTMLSSLKGAAITNVKVEGVSHFFTTLKGVKESVLEVILHLKQLRFEVKGDGPFTVSISAKGPQKIYGKNVEGAAKVVNKDLYIGEITLDKVKLELEAMIETGQGYLSADEREKKIAGFIAVDAYFSPVKKVNIKVEEARLGRKSNMDRIMLEIWTDGSIKPADALRESATILSSHFEHILSGKDAPKAKEEKVEEQAQKEAIEQKLYEIIIDELNLPSRVINALLRENIETVADLVKVGKESLTDMKGVGKKSIELIEEELKKMGLELK